MKLIDLTGKKFGKLTVLCKAKSQDTRTYWTCKCDCGNTIDVVGYFLTKGKTKSCGCSRMRKRDDKDNIDYSFLSVSKDKVCKFNFGVNCDTQDECLWCGWNPENKKKRVEKIGKLS